MLKLVIMVLLFGSVPGLQETPLVDLTSAIARNRLREPATASGSGSMVAYEGRSQPADAVSLELVSLQATSDDHGPILVCEIQLRNTGKQAIEIPVDLSSRDVEPASAAMPYQYLNGEIWLSTVTDAETRLPSKGLSLYGAPAAAGSLRTLKPGSAIRIRAKLTRDAVSGGDQLKSTPPQVRAFFALWRDSVTVQGDGRLHVHVQSVFTTIRSSNTLTLLP